MVYTKYRRKDMQTARLFSNGRSQAVRLPKEYQFRGENVYIQKVGEAVILVPVDKDWETFLHGLNSFSKDFMAEGRFQGMGQAREKL
jgi:antitoxin VapB